MSSTVPDQSPAGAGRKGVDHDGTDVLSPLGPTDRRVVGNYRLRGRLGSGGMGTVFLGVNPEGQPAAIKVIRSDLVDEAQFRERFRREVTAARRIRGTHVARVLDADPDADEPWMATEYVEGANLLATVTQHGPLDETNLIALAAGLAEGLMAVHAAGVVHRDLKPANILMTFEGPKIIDFGLARADDLTGNTSGGSVIGTVAWMAPEQLNGDPATPATDVFNWGLCVAFAARARHPFDAQTPAATAMRILSTEPGLDGVPDELLPVVTAALDRDPGRRPGAIRILATLPHRPPTDPASNAGADTGAGAAAGAAVVAGAAGAAVVAGAGTAADGGASHEADVPSGPAMAAASAAAAAASDDLSGGPTFGGAVVGGAVVGGAVVGGPVVGGAVVGAVVDSPRHSLSNLTLVVSVLCAVPSSHDASTVSVTSPVIEPGTIVVASVLPPGSTVAL